MSIYNSFLLSMTKVLKIKKNNKDDRKSMRLSQTVNMQVRAMLIFIKLNQIYIFDKEIHESSL